MNTFTALPFQRKRSVPPWASRQPIREELFGVERLEQHARTLAAAQPVTPKPTKGLSLGARLDDNATVLLDAYRSVVRAIDEEESITPAAEWLVDNFISSRGRSARCSDLPPGYYRQLPTLAQGPFAGYPRVLGVAWAFVAHTDSRFDTDLLCLYVDAYQGVQPLTIGELWALPITLRFVLVENLRRLAERILRSSLGRHEADLVADRLLGVGGFTAQPASVVLGDYGRAPLPDAFAVQLVHRLRDQDPSVTPALTWLDERLAAQGTTPDAAVRDEFQSHGAASVTVRNIITSLRVISDVDWAEPFARMSLVDRALAAGTSFAEMDFATRNLYRTAIEEMARRSDRTELEIARSAVALAQAAPAGDGGFSRERDPGYSLIAGGRRSLRATIGFRPPIPNWLSDASPALRTGAYVGAIAAIAAALLAVPLSALAALGLSGAYG